MYVPDENRYHVFEWCFYLRYSDTLLLRYSDRFDWCPVLVSVSGPTLMAMWSKALPHTVSCHSPLSRFGSHSGHVRKLASDLGLGSGFRQVLRFSPPVTAG